MPLQKQPITINFSKGLNLKSDPKQIQIGTFLEFVNSVFSVTGRLTKRPGFPSITALSDTTIDTLTTYNGALTALGASLKILAEGNSTWNNRGAIPRCQVSRQGLVNLATSVSQADMAISSTGLVCTVFVDAGPLGGSTSYKYQITDRDGQVVAGPTVLAPGGGNTILNQTLVWALGNYFVVVFSTTSTKLKYIAIPVATPGTPNAAVTITSTLQANNSNTLPPFSGVVTNSRLYLTYGDTSGPALKVAYLTTALALTISGDVASSGLNDARYGISICADETTPSAPILWVAYRKTAQTHVFTFACDGSLSPVLAVTDVFTPSSETVVNITNYAASGSSSVIIEASNITAIAFNRLYRVPVTQAGSVGSTVNLPLQVGLGSKAFIVASTPYVLAYYESANQPTYFLLKATTGECVSRIAYQNAPPGDNSGAFAYLNLGYCNVCVSGTTASLPALVRTRLIPVNKLQSGTNQTTYSTIGSYRYDFDFSSQVRSTAEIGKNLHVAGGFLWSFDGNVPVEHGFQTYPDIPISTNGTAAAYFAVVNSGGNLSIQDYYYQATYEWTDHQGNVFESAPSIPAKAAVTVNNSSVNCKIPSLKITYKASGSVKINIYRWSTAQQTFYQVTTTTTPLVSDSTTNTISFTDTLSDASIVGNPILYTTGGVLENIDPPPVSALTNFKNRVVYIDAENPNNLGFSKQVGQNTPVEFSDAFSIFVTPEIAGKGTVGENKAVAVMDDKLIPFKKNAIAYITGTGPDITGGQNDFSDPTFIISPVGCENQQSIVQMPMGLMFEASGGSGIWLLGRDLSVSFIGAPVQTYADSSVISAYQVPGTNQIRFNLSDGTILQYDHFEQQWGVFETENIVPVSTAIYEDSHTLVDASGNVYEQTSGSYTDGASTPVLMSFKTGWINTAGIQGFQRAYEMFLMGDYKSSHTLTVSIAYDYSDTATDIFTITPDSTVPLEQWRLFFSNQKCQAFQVWVEEAQTGTGGEGLTLSGLTFTVGVKGGTPKIPSSFYSGASTS